MAGIDKSRQFVPLKIAVLTISDTRENDDDTSVEFVRELMRTVFGKSERDAITFTALIEGQDKVACGPYPAPVATALLESAQQLIRAAGHRLLITLNEMDGLKEDADILFVLTTNRPEQLESALASRPGRDRSAAARRRRPQETRPALCKGSAARRDNRG